MLSESSENAIMLDLSKSYKSISFEIVGILSYLKLQFI